jgi:AcrR family transcriptional regulator
MAPDHPVTPNKRGARSRQVVLDAAERVIAAHGYAAATVAAIVEESGIPMSSVYHYFGSKEGVLLAVMERGAERFFAGLPEVPRRSGTPEEHLVGMVDVLAAALEAHPDFLRLTIVIEVQPPPDMAVEARALVQRLRGEALRRLQREIAVAFGISPRAAAARRLARFALAAVDGAFIASQGDRQEAIKPLLEHLPTALVAMHRAIDPAH